MSATRDQGAHLVILVEPRSGVSEITSALPLRGVALPVATTVRCGAFPGDGGGGGSARGGGDPSGSAPRTFHGWSPCSTHTSRTPDRPRRALCPHRGHCPVSRAKRPSAAMSIRHGRLLTVVHSTTDFGVHLGRLVNDIRTRRPRAASATTLAPRSHFAQKGLLRSGDEVSYSVTRSSAASARRPFTTSTTTRPPSVVPNIDAADSTFTTRDAQWRRAVNTDTPRSDRKNRATRTSSSDQ
jgi:hypothetical protein